LARQLAAGAADLGVRERAVREAEARVAAQAADLQATAARERERGRMRAGGDARESALQAREAELAGLAARLERDASALGEARSSLQVRGKWNALGQEAGGMMHGNMLATVEPRLQPNMNVAAPFALRAYIQDLAQTLDEREAASAAAAPGASMPPPRARSASLPREASDTSAPEAPVTLNSRQYRTMSALLASLQQTAARGGERLRRLERVLATIAADAAEPKRAASASAAVAGLGRELARLQAANAEFAAALQAAGTRGELAEVKARLEGQQGLLSAWEERVRAALEACAELQSPSRRNSMLLFSAGGPLVRDGAMPAGRAPASAPVSPALWGSALAPLPPLPSRRSALMPGPGHLPDSDGDGRGR
jgi:hypothetical protein